MRSVFTFCFAIFMCSCNTHPKEDSIEKWKTEIRETEQEFADLAHKEGIPIAFETFAAADAVLLRNDSLIVGLESLTAYFDQKKPTSDQVSLTWKPDFVDVATSGDLGYTYGKYIYTITDSIGNTRAYKGIFHTVWKKQPDGKWRLFGIDLTNNICPVLLDCFILR